MKIYEMHEVHFLRPGDGSGTHVVPFSRTLFTTEKLAMAKREELLIQSSDPEVIAARRLVGIDSVEYRVGSVEVFEN